MPVSVAIITCNEEKNIEAALESVRWADEIIVVDSESIDRTVEIAKRFTSKVIVRSWPGYAAQKQFASDQASHEWVLSIDADERVSQELAEEIKKIVGSSVKENGFYISRQNYYLKYPVYHSGWSPDYQLRLYRKEYGKWKGDFVHESVSVAGSTSYLKGKLHHYSIQSLSAHHIRLDRYTTLAASDLCRRRTNIGYADIAVRPIVAFLRSYIFRLGFLDGFVGIIIAYFAAYYVFMKYAKAWEKNS